MRKLLLLSITILSGFAGFAQKATSYHSFREISSANDSNPAFTPNSNTARTTAAGDTLALSNIPASAPHVLYNAGTGDTQGYLTGTNVWNDQAFAERYDFNGADSSMKVIGVIAQFGGVVNAASTHTINFNVWDIAQPTVISGSTTLSGYPDSLLDTVTVPFTQLGIGATADSIKSYFFATPTATLQSAFFVGYSISYNFNTLNGDTIGLVSSQNGTRTGAAYTPQVNIDALGDTSLDTVINVQNATLQSDNNWYDNYTQNDSLYNNLAIFPIVIIGQPTGISSITRHNLTFSGNYPNPAVNSTNIQFSLAAGADVTIQVMDLAGHTLSTIKQPNLAAGEHVVPVNTSAMAAGTYLYLIRTSGGDGMAGEMTVVR